MALEGSFLIRSAYNVLELVGGVSHVVVSMLINRRPINAYVKEQSLKAFTVYSFNVFLNLSTMSLQRNPIWLCKKQVWCVHPVILRSSAPLSVWSKSIHVVL